MGRPNRRSGYRQPRPSVVEVIVERRLLGLTSWQIARVLGKQRYRPPTGRRWSEAAVEQVLRDAGLCPETPQRVLVWRAGRRYWVCYDWRYWSSPLWYGYVEPVAAADGQPSGLCWICDAAGIRHPYYPHPVTMETRMVRFAIATERDRVPRGPELGSRAAERSLDDPEATHGPRGLTRKDPR